MDQNDLTLLQLVNTNKYLHIHTYANELLKLTVSIMTLNSCL